MKVYILERLTEDWYIFHNYEGTFSTLEKAEAAINFPYYQITEAVIDNTGEDKVVKKIQPK